MAASRCTLIAGLDEVIAERIIAPAMTEVLTQLEAEAKRRAPEVKVWVTAHDERVRPSHVETDGQAIPANLRFQVPKVNTGNDANDIRIGYDMAREPRDPTLPIGNRINCRCDAPHIPTMLAESIHKTSVRTAGTRCSGEVETRFPRAAESEQGTAEDAPAHFMLGALEAVRRQIA